MVATTRSRAKITTMPRVRDNPQVARKPIPQSGVLPIICPHCGGRLFLETEHLTKRLRYFWGCVNCARTYKLDGGSTSSHAGELKSVSGR